MTLMSKTTNHTSNFGHGAFEDRTLDDIELDAGSGGATASKDDLILAAVLAAAAHMLPRG